MVREEKQALQEEIQDFDISIEYSIYVCMYTYEFYMSMNKVSVFM